MGRNPEGHDFVYHSPEIRAVMSAERDRTKVPLARLFEGTNLPAGLTANRITNFYGGQLQKLPRQQFEAILQRFQSLPTVESVAITSGILETLRRHCDRTGKGPQAILAGAKARPDGLRSETVRKWLDGTSTVVRKDHLEFILARYGACPDRGAKPRKAELRRLVRSELVRTQTSFRDLPLIVAPGDCAEGWKSLDHASLMLALRLLQDRPSQPRPSKKRRPERRASPRRARAIPLTEKLQFAIRQEVRRTRLTDRELSQLLGRAVTRDQLPLDPDELASALGMLRALPSCPKPNKRMPWLQHELFLGEQGR